MTPAFEWLYTDIRAWIRLRPDRPDTPSPAFDRPLSLVAGPLATTIARCPAGKTTPPRAA